MVYEGKIGGPGRGQGRPNRDARISVQLQNYVRQNLGKKVTRALERALNEDAGERINLDAIKLIVDMEHKEAKLQLSEDAADLDSQSKEELLATLYELVNDPQTGQVITATFTPIPTPEQTVAEIDYKERVTEERKRRAVTKRNQRDKKRAQRATAASIATSSKPDRGSSSPAENGTDNGSAREFGRGDASPDHEARPNPVTQAALRRAADRRRAS
jgi:hypothetical protein